MLKSISMQDLHEKLNHLGKDELILDVRSPEEFEEGHIPGALNIDYQEVADRAEELKKFKSIYIHCRSGGRARVAASMLLSAGLTNLVCIGGDGMLHWEAAGFPIER